MTLQEAEALAQDTGAVTNVRLHGRWDNTVFTSNELLEFVGLVATRERERCAQMCEAYAAEGIGREIADAIRRME